MMKLLVISAKMGKIEKMHHSFFLRYQSGEKNVCSFVLIKLVSVYKCSFQWTFSSYF